MDAIDTDKNGQINYTEFIASYADDKEMFKKDNVLSLFQAIDKDGNGTVDKHELRDLLQSKYDFKRPKVRWKDASTFYNYGIQNYIVRELGDNQYFDSTTFFWKFQPWKIKSCAYF